VYANCTTFLEVSVQFIHNACTCMYILVKYVQFGNMCVRFGKMCTIWKNVCHLQCMCRMYEYLVVMNTDVRVSHGNEHWHTSVTRRWILRYEWYMTVRVLYERKSTTIIFVVVLFSFGWSFSLFGFVHFFLCITSTQYYLFSLIYIITRNCLFVLCDLFFCSKNSHFCWHNFCLPTIFFVGIKLVIDITFVGIRNLFCIFFTYVPDYLQFREQS